MDQYQELFEEDDVDGTLLLAYSVDDLKDLGVTKGNHRRKIVTKFKEYLQNFVK